MSETMNRAAFERWMVEAKKCVIGSHDPYPAGIERDMWECWQAALTAHLSEKDAALQAAIQRAEEAELEASVLRGEHAMNAEAYHALQARVGKLEEALDKIIHNSDIWSEYDMARFARAALASREGGEG